MSKIKLSIIIINYNTKDLLVDCLDSLERVRSEIPFEVIVVDNASIDESVEFVKKNYVWVKLIESKTNVGFSKGNNLARKNVRGDYVLFLNSDTQVKKGTLKKSVEFLKAHEETGVLTCKMVMKNGELDKDARRSFPTPWVALTHLILRLDKIFPHSRIFAQYWYGYEDPNTVHEIDVAQGAYFMARKKLLDQVGWFDEDYFLDGEDIDLSWRIKETGKTIIYYPDVEILHVKKASKKKPTKEMRRKFVSAGAESMELFYKKHMSTRYPFFVSAVVIAGVRFMKYIRVAKTYLN